MLPIVSVSKIAALKILVLGLLSSSALAKRAAPDDVAIVKTDEAVFSVPHFLDDDPQNGGFIEAHDPRNQERLWRIQVYKTPYIPNLEQDIQDVFIKSLSYDKVHRLLIVSDEKGRLFILNLKNQRVTRIR